MDATIETAQTGLRPGRNAIIILALGQAGVGLVSYIGGALLNYFYMPPEVTDSHPIFPPFIIQSSIFMGLTILGILSFGGRFLDGVLDPLIANTSDKTVSRFGKRRIFMAVGAVPLAALAYIQYHPVTSEVSALNTWLLGACIIVYYISYALYVIPFTALISELGHHEEDRLRISLIVGLTWSMGYLIGAMTPAVQHLLEASYTPTVAFQTTVGVFAALAGVLLLLPVFFLNENKYTVHTTPENTAFIHALKSVFQSRPFRYFVSAYLLYWLALSFIQSGNIYYVTVIFNLEKSNASLFSAISFLGSFALFAPIGKLIKKYGDKKVMSSAYVIFSAIFAFALLPLPGKLVFWVISIAAAYPLACFSIQTYSVITYIIYAHEKKTGKRQAGMFYAVSAFVTKVGISLANLVFPSLLLFGKSVEHPLGVQLSLAVAMVFCLAGYFVFKGYREE